LNRVEKDLAEQQLVRVVAQPSHDLPAKGRPFDSADVFGQSALPAHVHGGNRHPLGGPGQLVEPIARVTRIAMKLEHRRMATLGARSYVLRMDSRATHT
jgi:hypothetical protein